MVGENEFNRLLGKSPKTPTNDAKNNQNSTKQSFKNQFKTFKSDEETELIFCDISAWEIAMLIKKGKLQVDETPSNFIKAILDSRNYIYKSITPNIADLSVNLGKEINKDPADRLIVATSIFENSELVTADKNLIKSDLVKTIW